MVRVGVGCPEIDNGVNLVVPPFEADDYLADQLVATWVRHLRMLLAFKALTEHF